MIRECRIKDFIQEMYRIGCLSISDKSESKTLYLNADASDSAAKSMYDSADSQVYTVPVGKVFIAGKVSYYLENASGYSRGRIGETAAADDQIEKHVMCFGNGKVGGDFNDCPGVFAATKYITAECSGSNNLRKPTLLYGIETDIVPGGIVEFNLAGYTLTDYTKLKLLVLLNQPTSSTKYSFKHFDGSDWNSDYTVPAGKIFLAGKVSYWTENATASGLFGESATANGTISKQVFACGNSSVASDFKDVYGVFAASKYVTAQVIGSNALRAPTYIYGVEIDA